MSEHADLQRTSVADLPIGVTGDDKLDLWRYASALAGFIAGSETPITVGMQGEWGSGKTSLMNLLCTELAARNSATAWVNTWEYAIFRSTEQIAPGVLHGLIVSLKRECEKQRAWTGVMADSAAKAFGFLGKLAKNAALAVGKHYGVDYKPGETQSGDSASVSEIAALRHEIEAIIAGLTKSQGGPYERVVFFIDDLDRIEPGVAVEVLEALKNVFDVPGSVFILAIDYDVVVKGLERKFGRKTEENEREFRSFFDKIIQVPFSLPVSAYQVDDLLADHFRRIGRVPVPDAMSAYAKITHLTVGAVPRSIKRLVNVFSLLCGIGDQRRGEDGSPTPATPGHSDDFCLYALLGLQLAYPRAYRLLVSKPDFTRWDQAFAVRNNIHMESFADAGGEDELVDEEWEQVLFSLCEADPYLKQRRPQILTAFNVLRDTMGERLSEAIERSLQMASISAVEAADERSARRDGTRVDATDMIGRGVVSAGEKLWFRDSVQRRVHQEVPLTLVERTGAGGSFIVRIAPFSGVEKLSVWSPTTGAWYQERPLPTELPCKGASAALHKQLGICGDEEITETYTRFGEDNFVRATDPQTSLADIREGCKRQGH